MLVHHGNMPLIIPQLIDLQYPLHDRQGMAGYADRRDLTLALLGAPKQQAGPAHVDPLFYVPGEFAVRLRMQFGEPGYRGGVCTACRGVHGRTIQWRKDPGMQVPSERPMYIDEHRIGPNWRKDPF